MYANVALLMLGSVVVQSETYNHVGMAYEYANSDVRFNGSLYVGGYRGVAGINGSIHVGLDVYPFASAHLSADRAAYEVQFLRAPDHDVRCSGSSSCAKIGSMYGDIECMASNSCQFSNIAASEFIPCQGDQSCAYSNITFSDPAPKGHTADMTGAYSFMYGIIRSPGFNNPMEIECTGFYACYGATLICHKNDTCEINCGANGCYMFEIQCHSNCVVRTHNTVIAPINDSTLRNVSFDPLTYFDSWCISETLDNECNTLNATLYDNFNYRGGINSTTRYAAPVCCRGGHSCEYASNITIEQPTHSSFVCSSENACEEAVVQNYNGTVFCLAYYACFYSEIASKNIYCTSYEGCVYMIATVENVFCTGNGSCYDSVIQSRGYINNQTQNELNVYFLAYRSGRSAQIYCADGDICHVFCGGQQSCLGVHFYCSTNSSCTVECDTQLQSSKDCPIIHGTATSAPVSRPSIDGSLMCLPTFEPTIHPSIDPTVTPTFDPTSYPSFMPTLNPTSNPTFDPTSHPSIVPTSTPTFDPTSHPSIMPTLNPTFDPTSYPSIMPTLNPTFDPTSYPSFTPTLNPTFDPTSYPSIDPTAAVTIDETSDGSDVDTANITRNILGDSMISADGWTMIIFGSMVVLGAIFFTLVGRKKMDKQNTEIKTRIETEMQTLTVESIDNNGEDCKYDAVVAANITYISDETKDQFERSEISYKETEMAVKSADISGTNVRKSDVEDESESHIYFAV